MAVAGAAVLHSPPLFLTVCSFQHGVNGAIRAILECPTIQGIHGRLILQQATASLFPSGKGTYVDMETLPTLMEHRHQLMAAAIDTPRAAANLYEMLAMHPRLRDLVAEYAAFNGNLELMDRICENAKERRLPWDGSYIDPMTNCPNDVHSSATHLCQLAAFHGHLSILMLLRRPNRRCMRHGSLTTYSDIEVAAESGHYLFVQHAIEYAQARHGHGHTYWGLRNRIPSKQTGHATYRWCQHLNLLDVVAGDGKLEMAKVLLQHKATHSDAAIDNAAANGHLDMVQYIHETRESKCSTQAMDGAAANGHLEVVQFLHDHRTEGCTTDAIDEAAIHGHDSIVRFLLAKRKEGGSVKAMNAYVAKGDFTMVMLLALGKCSSGSVNLAAAQGQLDIVKYLVGHKEVAFATPAIEAAVKHGHVDVVEYLHSRRPEMCVAKFMQMAHAANQSSIVEYFDSRRCTCCQGIGRDELLAAKTTKKRRRRN
ncbi:Aste57867_15546 [Aphanomyces stellatus]|uniref:Aste57867_15546 protein n=1 Tax=Aphanomyces stellatus TaxID=120398 RepID=A0A485L3E0_9STRA|nr:hypothetical protein As57867_015490 [Aphanomyces stellatus]VFT92348.1 Aste57867_15546 [Aphanomyces stellatus]